MNEAVFRNLALPVRTGVFDIDVRDGRIAAITPAAAAAEWVALPPLADLHLHANRAFTAGDETPRDFHHAVSMVMTLAETFGEADYARHAERTFARLLAKGTTRARTHADVGGPFGMKSLMGTLQAADRFGDRIEVETVALLGPSDDPASPSGGAVLRAAHGAGAGLLGAVPCHYSDPGATIDAVLDLAVELDCGVDVHLDEHLDPANCWSGHLAAGAKRRGLGGRITLSHGSAIAVMPADARNRIVDALAAAEIMVVSLPATNLYIQDRGAGTPARRGLTLVREMIDAGVAVRFASDNIRDAFYPYGSGDMLEVAALGAVAAHVDAPADLVPAICAGRSDLTVGDAADFLLVRGTSLAEIIAERPAERRRVKAGCDMPIGPAR